MSRPLATVETALKEGDHVRIGDAVFALEVWPVDAPEVIAAINTAHAAVVDPMQARLAMAQEELRFALGCTRHDAVAQRRIATALAAIDAEAPPEMVPLERYKQLEAVLADALEFTEAKKWRARVEKALAVLDPESPVGSDAWRARAWLTGANPGLALDGRDEPGPAKAYEPVPPLLPEESRGHLSTPPGWQRGTLFGEPVFLPDDPEEP